jgi:hypothetical protein
LWSDLDIHILLISHIRALKSGEEKLVKLLPFKSICSENKTASSGLTYLKKESIFDYEYLREFEAKIGTDRKVL